MPTIYVKWLAESPDYCNDYGRGGQWRRIGIGVGDRVFIQEFAYYSVISGRVRRDSLERPG
ncbi:MAG: hypothetical protein U0V70_15235 [Terriglobia bacterium]